MDHLQRLTAGDLVYLAPELTLVIAAIALSIIDLFMPKEKSRSVLGWLAIASVVIAMIFVIGDLRALNPIDPVTGEVISQDAIQLLHQSFRIDDFASIFKLLILGGTGLILLMSIGSVRQEDIPHVGEYYYLFLPAALGGMIMASSGDLITLFVGLELLSISSYILVGMRKKNRLSNEAAFKYVVLGSVSSAVILYGMSFLYGVSGSTNIAEINAAISMNHASFEGLIYVAFFLLLAGFGFKIAAAPFHAWAPDVYQGSSSPVTAFLAVVSKAAAFALMFRVLYNLFGMGGIVQTPLHEDMFLALSVLAAVTMIAGNAIALRQKNMKRLLAYSGIANSGYLLVPIAMHFSMFHFYNYAEFMFYLIAYLFMNIGAIAVLMAVHRADNNEDIAAFAGLYYRAPFTAAAMVILLLSFAGIPVTAGFFGKLFILLGTIQGQNYWLPAIMIASSVVSFYYYFGIIRQMFMRTSQDSDKISLNGPLAATIWICTAATLLLGFMPKLVLGYLAQIFSVSKDLFLF